MTRRQIHTPVFGPEFTDLGYADFETSDLSMPLMASATLVPSAELAPMVPSVFVAETPNLPPLVIGNDTFEGEIVSQTALGGVAGALAAFAALDHFREKVVEVHHTFEAFHAFIDLLFFDSHGPKESIADMVAANQELLLTVHGMLEIVAQDVSAIVDAVDGLSEQIDTDIVNDQMIAAMSLLDQIGALGEPTSAQRDDLVQQADDLMNDLIVKIPPMLNEAPMEMLAGLIAPTVIAATQAYIAAIMHASDEGLGETTVKSKINAAHSIVAEIYAEDGPLSNAISGGLSGYSYETDNRADGFTYELYSAYEPGSAGHNFLWVETITGPNGTFEQRVVADDSFVAGSLVDSDHLDTFDQGGSMHGVHADGINLSGVSPFAGLKIDAVVPFHPNAQVMHNNAQGALEDMRHQANVEVLSGELVALGQGGAEFFLASLPSTAGLTVSGGNGNDTINSLAGTSELSLGAEIADLIDGGAGDDTIESHGGPDALFGGSGFDTLRGGDGNDKLFGGQHDDDLFGGSGRDQLQGGGGRDYLDGGDDDDFLYQAMRGDSIDLDNPGAFVPGASDGGTIYGGYGDDVLVGDDGDDALFGGHGFDRIFGFDGPDQIQGGYGKDEIDGGVGADVIDGGVGDDVILGGAGDDVIAGGVGNDVIVGGSGDDTIDGGFGVDTVIFHGEFHGLVNDGGIVIAGTGLVSASDYTVAKSSSGDWIVTDLRPESPDGVDIIRGANPSLSLSMGDGVEYLQFDNVLLELEPTAIDQGFMLEPEPPVYTPVFEQDFDDFTNHVDEPWF